MTNNLNGHKVRSKRERPLARSLMRQVRAESRRLVRKIKNVQRTVRRELRRAMPGIAAKLNEINETLEIIGRAWAEREAQEAEAQLPEITG